jgi:rubrerythrin
MRSRHAFFAMVAKKQGIEHEHANRFMTLIKGEGTPIQIQLTFPASPLSKTTENLCAAAETECELHSQLYRHWAAIAEQENFDDISRVWQHAPRSPERTNSNSGYC